MNTTRTTVVLPDIVLEHIKMSLDEADTISAFLERAAVNQLEKEFSDFEIIDGYYIIFVTKFSDWRYNSSCTCSEYFL